MTRVETPKKNEIPKVGDTIKVYDVFASGYVDAKVLTIPKAGAGSWWGSWGFKIQLKDRQSFTTYQHKRWEIGGY